MSDATPPTLVLQPERDDFIPARGNHLVIDEAKEAGVDATIVPVPFAWYGFDTNPATVGGQIKTSVTVSWLEELGLAPEGR